MSSNKVVDVNVINHLGSFQNKSVSAEQLSMYAANQ